MSKSNSLVGLVIAILLNVYSLDLVASGIACAYSFANAHEGNKDL